MLNREPLEAYKNAKSSKELVDLQFDFLILKENEDFLFEFVSDFYGKTAHSPII